MAKRKVNAKGRNERHDRYIALDFPLLASDAYRSLSTGARALLVEFNRLYNGANNGELFMSQRKAAELLGITSHTAAARYINELIDRRFISIRLKGSFSVKTRRATTYVLAQFKFNDQTATRAFKSWQPSKEQKQRGRKRATTGSKCEPILLDDWPYGGDLVAQSA